MVCKKGHQEFRDLPTKRKYIFMKKEVFTQGLLDFLNDSPTAYHAVKNAIAILNDKNFEELSETESWSLKEDGKYFVRRNNSSVIAFVCGSGMSEESGFRIIGAHTDSPNFKIKPGDCIVTKDGYVQLNTETYGGLIMSTWFDRPLSVAGRVVLGGSGVFETEELIIDLKKPILMIPNLCIHFNREVNEQASINKQTDVLPLLCLEDKNATKDGDDPKSDYFLDIIKEELVKQGKCDCSILDYELFLYEWDKGTFVGSNEEFISAPRIDNLSMVYASLIALTESPQVEAIQVMAAFDNEEVGSTTTHGANSSFMSQILTRICTKLGCDEEGYHRALANSIIVSADTGHAVHPNYSDKHDPTNRPVLGGGPIIKYSAYQRYATTATTAAIFKNACTKAKVPYQNFVIRSDITGGSTIGAALSSITSIPTVDVGTAILAMHSIREFGSVVDNIYTKEAFRAFYSEA